jgi:uncharacterized RDD family membrane protein YckC
MAQAALQGQHAGFVSRAIAFAADLIVISLAIFAVVALTEAIVNFFTLYGLLGRSVLRSDVFRDIVVGVTGLLSAAIAIGYPVGSWVLLGQTPGKALMGMRIVRVDGRPLSLRCALLRYAGYWVSALPLFLGFLWVLADDRRQGWHDKLARTYVVYDWQPFSGNSLPR